MADSSPPTDKIEQLANSIPEVAITGKEPPERYGYYPRDYVVGNLDAGSLPIMEIAAIDVGLLASPSPTRQQLNELRSALSSFGCFMAINHGMTSSFLDEVHSIVKQFFALPTVEKRKYASEANSREGYGIKEYSPENREFARNNYLALSLSPENQRQLRFWPEYPVNFRETISAYSTKLQPITEVLLKAIAMCLNLDEHCFLDKYGDQPIIRSRFNFYPPRSKHDQVLGLVPHTDPSIITIVFQDKEVEGLQILKDNQWFRVPIYPDGLLINIGDQMEILSNGLFKSPTHRVVTKPEEERISLAVVFYPDPENDIEPADGLADETRPRLYKKVKNYQSGVIQLYLQGKHPIETVKI